MNIIPNRFLFLLFACASFAYAEPASSTSANANQICEQEQSNTSLETLTMRACLLKTGNKETKNFAFQITFTNISKRKIFLTVEQDELRRFDVSLSVNKVKVLERAFTDADCMPEEIYAPFTLMPIQPGESVIFVTRFSSFASYVEQKKIAKESSFFLSIPPASDFYVFEGETAQSRYKRSTEEQFAKKTSRFTFFRDFKIDWSEQKTSKN